MKDILGSWQRVRASDALLVSWSTTSCPECTAARLASGQDRKAVTLRLCQGPEEAEQVQDLHLGRMVELHGPQRSVAPRVCACHLKRTSGLPRVWNCGRRCLMGWLSASLRLAEGELLAERSQRKRCSLLLPHTRRPLCQQEPVPLTTYAVATASFKGSI